MRNLEARPHVSGELIQIYKDLQGSAWIYSDLQGSTPYTDLQGSTHHMALQDSPAHRTYTPTTYNALTQSIQPFPMAIRLHPSVTHPSVPDAVSYNKWHCFNASNNVHPCVTPETQWRRTFVLSVYWKNVVIIFFQTINCMEINSRI